MNIGSIASGLVICMGAIMNIDVDIKITEDDKEEGKCLVKHFSGKLDQYNGIPIIKSDNNKKFEEFLAEVLTGSGQMVRSSLLGRGSVLEENKYPMIQSEAEELQYTLTLGTGQSLSGRIPLGELNLFSAPEVISGITSEKSAGKNGNHESFLLNKYYSFRNKRQYNAELHVVEEVIGAMMQKAIRKYENNIFYGKDS